MLSFLSMKRGGHWSLHCLCSMSPEIYIVVFCTHHSFEESNGCTEISKMGFFWCKFYARLKIQFIKSLKILNGNCWLCTELSQKNLEDARKLKKLRHRKCKCKYIDNFLRSSSIALSLRRLNSLDTGILALFTLIRSLFRLLEIDITMLTTVQSWSICKCSIIILLHSFQALF